MTIPQTDPRAAYQAQAEEIDAAVSRVLRSGRYLLGPETDAFETEWARYVGTAHAVAAASGTDALHLALRACGVGPGDEVITVSHTAVATVAAIDLCGATPVLVDIAAGSFNLDIAGLEPARTARTRAVVLVHLYGQPADVGAVKEFCGAHGLRLIEDCAQAHGACIGGQRVGSFGDAAAFSFYPTKNLGALGDGGAAVTNDPALAGTMRALRQYGWRERRYVSEESGWNGRMDELQAAVLRVKLRTLDAGNDQRRALAAVYDECLRGTDKLRLPPRGDDNHRAVYHQYVVRCRERERLIEGLGAAGVGTLIHYPVPIHRQPAYAARRLARRTLRETDGAAAQVLSLPMFPQLGRESAGYVSDTILRVLESV